MVNFVPIILALILTLVHYSSQYISNLVEKFHSRILSFSAGLFISLIFVYLLPEVVRGAEFVNIYLLLLVGFVLFHITEKFIYQHVKDKSRLMKDLAELHMVGFFIDHFIIGFILVLTFEFSTRLNFLIFMPFLLHTISSSISLEHINLQSKTIANKLFLGFSTFFGAIIATILDLSNFYFFSVYSIALGALLYVVVRDMIPKGQRGSPLFFLIGVLVTLITISLAL